MALSSDPAVEPIYNYQATFVGGYDEAEASRAVIWCTDGSDKVSALVKDEIKSSVNWLTEVLSTFRGLGSAGVVLDIPPPELEPSDDMRKSIHVLLFRARKSQS